ncbi:MAG: hypothetical protein MPF33_02735 [Candidatus Aramenus sp.]|nr:hypothetical protein [Candidatus Aramenus sp.]
MFKVSLSANPFQALLDAGEYKRATKTTTYASNVVPDAPLVLNTIESRAGVHTANAVARKTKTPVKENLKGLTPPRHARVLHRSKALLPFMGVTP